MGKKIDLDVILKLNKLFEKKKWNQIENSDYVYESLCALSENISEDEQAHQLFLDLIDQYNWMSYNDYSNQINHLLYEILINSNIKMSKIYSFPIIKPEDQNKNKSGNSISYMMKCNKPYLRQAKHIKFEEITLFSDLSTLTLKPDEYLILVDDYIGSGETLFACINEIEKINSSLCDKIIIATIAVQNDTIVLLNNYKFYYSMAVSKGISSRYSSPIKEEHLETMLSLEKKLISGRNFSLGYEESEGLVTMLRTPDNTFPIFWHEYKKSTGLYPPFPRD